MICRTFGVTKDGIKIEVDIRNSTAYFKNTFKRIPIGTTVQTSDGIWQRLKRKSIRVFDHNPTYCCGCFR